MDGAPFESGYLHMVDDKPVLKYVDTTDKNYLYSQQEIYEGWEFFVPERGERKYNTDLGRVKRNV